MSRLLAGPLAPGEGAARLVSIEGTERAARARQQREAKTAAEAARPRVPVPLSGEARRILQEQRQVPAIFEDDPRITEDIRRIARRR